MGDECVCKFHQFQFGLSDPGVWPDFDYYVGDPALHEIWSMVDLEYTKADTNFVLGALQCTVSSVVVD